MGHHICVAILLCYGANDKIRNYIKLTPRDEAKGEAIETFALFDKKVIFHFFTF
jgi:hypothetical protein